MLVAGVLAGVSLVSCYAFLTRVLPDRFAQFDSIAGYRLSDPIGYWNGLSIFAVMGLLLALGFAARARSAVTRGVASALPVMLVATVFFTFSRGAWVALAFGFLIALLLDPRRLQLLATGLVLAPWSALGVWLCSRSPALTTIGSSFDEASAQGRSLLLWTAVLSAASGLTGLAFPTRVGGFGSQRERGASSSSLSPLPRSRERLRSGPGRGRPPRSPPRRGTASRHRPSHWQEATSRTAFSIFPQVVVPRSGPRLQTTSSTSRSAGQEQGRSSTPGRHWVRRRRGTLTRSTSRRWESWALWACC